MIFLPLVLGAGAIAWWVRQRGIVEQEATSRPAVQPAFAVAVPPEASELGFDEFSRPAGNGAELSPTPFRMFMARISDAFEWGEERPVQSDLVTGEPMSGVGY